MKFNRNTLTKDQLLLYAVTDRHWLNGRTLHSVVKESLDGGVTFVQLREKQLDEAHFMEEAKDLQALCREYNVPFIINDNVDIALAMDADGVHVGQSDMEAGDVRAKLGPDKIIGVLNAKEYFRLEDKSRSVVMGHAVSQPYFVPDTVKADVLFRNMKKKKCSMAIVLDEYGGMTGIVTLNDLIEQLVGELEEDTFPELEPLENGAWKVRGTALLEEMSEMLAIPLPSEEYDTFNGLVFHALGSIPQDGTELSLEIDRLCITDMIIHNHKVESAVVTIKETSDTEQSEEERK